MKLDRFGRIMGSASIVLLVVLTPPRTQSQTADEELANLRAHLALPASARLELSASPLVPKAENLRLFIATGLDVVVRRNLHEWLESWSQKNDKRYGSLEFVDAIENADIILARYVLRDQTKTAIESSTGTATTLDVFSGKLVQAPVSHVSTSTLAPVWAYIIRHEGERYIILWRYADLTTVGENKKTGKELLEDFTDLLEAKSRRLN